MTSKARQQLFAILGQAPNDTHRGLVQFLQNKICDQIDTPLAEIGDKALAKHLNALVNGSTQLSNYTSPRARKASQTSPLKGEFMAWGIGDANCRGEWADALAAAKRLAEAKQWRLGQTLAYLTDLLQDPPSNRLVTATTTWLLDGDMQPHLRDYLHARGNAAEDRLYEARALHF